MAKLRELDFSPCTHGRCKDRATHAVDSDTGWFFGAFCEKHAKRKLAKVEAEEASGEYAEPPKSHTVEEFRALFKTCPQ